MTMEAQERKRSMFFWKKSHSQQSIRQHNPDGTPVPVAVEGGSPQDIHFEPDQGSEFVEKDVNFSSAFMPFIKNYVSNLSHNKSPTKLPYPPNFYYPASSLQHQMNLQMHHIDLLLGANLLSTPLERFIGVLKYSLSTCSVTKFPYKPIIAFLGETQQSTVVTSDGQTNDTTFYVGEQVEKEPSTCAFFITNPVRGVSHSGHVALVPKFKQAHVQATFVGQRQTVLEAPNGAWRETYVGDVPDLMIRLLRMHTELGGSIYLNCIETGYAASIQFKDKPIFGGVKNAIAGNITLNGRELYTIEGNWDEVTFLVDSITRQRFELFNRTTTPKLKVQTLPLDQQPPTSGERSWGPLLDCLLKQEFEKAKVVKAQLDVDHHAQQAKYEINPYQPAFFQKCEGGWTIKDPSLAVTSQGGLATM